MTRLEERIRSGLQEAAERIPDAAPAHATSRHKSSRPAGVWVGVAAVVVVLVVFGGLALLTGGGGGVANDPVPTSSTTSTSASPFLGTWVTTDVDEGESTPTMVIAASEDESVEMVMHDDFAAYELVPDSLVSVCEGPSTMTGTGRFQGVTELVFPAPVLTCDDGSQPIEPPCCIPLQEVLANLTFSHDPGADTLTDNLGSVWTRQSADPSPEPTTPPPSEAEVTELLNGFLDARVAGEAAQPYLNIPEGDIPLLYATSSGAPYERAELEPVLGIEWPYGFSAFKVRLFAGDTVVEQLFFIPPDGSLGLEYQWDGFGTDIAPTTEDGQPVAVPYDLFDGEVSLEVAHPWVSTGADFLRLIPAGAGPTTDGGERNDWDELWLIADPAVTACQTDPGPADAEALAESIRSEPGVEASAPVAVSVGGAEGLMVDVAIAAGAPMTVAVDENGNLCNHEVLSPLFDRDAIVSMTADSATGRTTGELMRLYLFDAPEGSSMRTLALAIVAPESRFESVVERAMPVVESIEFHSPR